MVVEEDEKEKEEEEGVEVEELRQFLLIFQDSLPLPL